MKTKRKLFLLPILLMATLVFLTTGCSDDDDDDNAKPYSEEDMSGTFENVAERIKVELSDNGSAVLTKVEGDQTGQDGEVDDAATWEIDNYEAPAGVTSEDEPLSIIIEHTNSEFDEPYVLIIESVDELKDHWQKTLSRVEDGEDGGDDGDGGLYDISYFDGIEYTGEEELNDGTMYKEWKVSSSTHPNLTMTIHLSSDNTDGSQIKEATYDFGVSSDLSSGAAVGMMKDEDETDGWNYITLSGGEIKVEDSSESGCTITLTDAHNSNNSDEYFNGTAEVTF